MIAIIFFACLCCGFFMYKCMKMTRSYYEEKSKDRQEMNKMQIQINSLDYQHQYQQHLHQHQYNHESNISKNSKTITTNMDSIATPTCDDRVASISNHTNQSSDLRQIDHRKHIKALSSASAIRNDRIIFVSNNRNSEKHSLNNSISDHHQSNEGQYDDIDGIHGIDDEDSENTDNIENTENEIDEKSDIDENEEKNFEHLRIPSIFRGLKHEDSMKAEAGSKEPSQNEIEIREIIEPINNNECHHRNKESLQTVIIHTNTNHDKIKNRNNISGVSGQSNDDEHEHEHDDSLLEHSRIDSLNVNPSISSPSYAIAITHDSDYDDDKTMMMAIHNIHSNNDTNLRKLSALSTPTAVKNNNLSNTEIKIDPIPETIEFAATPQQSGYFCCDDPATPLSQNTAHSINTYTILFGPSRRNSSENDIQIQQQQENGIKSSNETNDEEDRLSLGTATPTQQTQRDYIPYL